MDQLPERKAHMTPCDALRAAQIALGVLDTRMENHEDWQRRQNGSLEKVVKRMEDFATVEAARHDDNKATIIQAKEEILQLRWQMRLGFIILGLLLVSEHPLFTTILKLLGV